MPTRPSQRPFNVSYYARNRAQEIERVRVRQAATLKFLRDLRRVPCADCGGTFEPYQMDFDHRDPTTKSFEVTTGRAMLMSRDRLLEEVAKCEILCANCHAIRSARQAAQRGESQRTSRPDTARSVSARRHAVKRRDFVLALRDRPCADCQGQFPAVVMEFDHRDAAQKRFNVAHSWCRSVQSISDEAAKCDLVCRNCHRRRTLDRRNAR